MDPLIQRVTKALKPLNLSDMTCSKELFVTFGVNETNELCAASTSHSLNAPVMRRVIPAQRDPKQLLL